VTILITGSYGLIGATLARYFADRDISVTGVDLRSTAESQRFDISDLERIKLLLPRVSGIIHLAAVSRVIDGQRDPTRCWEVNVESTRKLLDAAVRSSNRPWFIYASSREVYGTQATQPVAEDAPLQPLNVYARSKVAAEMLVAEARGAGLATAILRFASVYGRIDDHRDRVVPAFLPAAVAGGVLRVDGKDCAFDVNHVDDVVRGIARVADVLDGGERLLPALHFVSGRSTGLIELAQMCCRIGGRAARIVEAPSRDFDVHRFVGDPRRAREVLGWQSTIDLETGLARLAAEFARHAP
jgi:nucleoside-diphosphate-sugar epimerase